MQRHRFIKCGLWLSEEENKAMTELCQKTGLSRANLLRKFIMSKPIKERPNVDFIELTNEIYQIGNIFNQLVRRANSLGTVSDNDMKEAQRVYRQVHRLMREGEKTWR